MILSHPARLLALLVLALLLGGCSIKRIAINQLGAALSEGAGTAFAAESDIEFAGQAVPFSLKLIESLLEEAPDNGDLLIAASSGFTQYAFVWVQQPADFLESTDLAAATRQRARARAFFLRAHGYSLRALEARHPGFTTTLDRDPRAAAAQLGPADLTATYWTFLSLGAAISLGKTDPALVARQSHIEALADRAFALDPDWGDGALHEFMISYELARPGAGTGAEARARRHFEKVVADTGGRRAGPFVTVAESISVQKQDKAEFTALLERALAIDPDQDRKTRLATLVAQQRARWLLGRVDELFLE